MGRKTPPHKAYPAWTEARYRSFIRSALRKAYTRWPPKFETMNKARRVVSGQRHKYEYQCNHCKEWFKQKEGKKSLVQVDHITPAGSSVVSFDKFIKGLFVGVDELQVLCTTCHAVKTKEEKSNV